MATEEFARLGLAGARVDEIAARTGTTKRMIYYYFGSKEQLFTAVLEQVYAVIRQPEQQLDVEHLDPVAAIRRLAELTFDHHEAHPDFVRLVGIENIHEAEHIAASLDARLAQLPGDHGHRAHPGAGRADGVFTAEVDAVDLHAMISSFCFFRVANRHTFRTIFGRDLTAARPARALPHHARRHGDRLPHGRPGGEQRPGPFGRNRTGFRTEPRAGIPCATS